MTVTDRLYGFDTGASFKQACYVASTGNLTLSSTQSIDGIHASTGVRVLVKDQTTATENGIYEVRASSWARTADCDGARDIIPGTLVYVDRGTANGDTMWAFNSSSTATTIDIGTDSVALSNITPTIADTSGGTVTATGSTAARTLADRFGEVANVKDFGAAGDGATDDTTAVSAAITSVLAGGVVYFPPGTYKITSVMSFTLTGQVSIIGDNAILDVSSITGGAAVIAVTFLGSVGTESAVTSANEDARTFTSGISVSTGDAVLIAQNDGDTPAADLTFSATTVSTACTVTASASVFTAADVGKSIIANSSSVYIISYSSGTSVGGIVETNTALSSSSVSSGNWSLKTLFAPSRNSYIKGEFGRVKAVSGGVVTLSHDLHDTYDDGYVNVQKMSGGPLSISGLTISGNTDLTGLFIQYIAGLYLENVTVKGCRLRGIHINSCFDGSLTNCRVIDAVGALSNAYGLQFQSSQNFTTTGCRAEGLSHGVTHSGGLPTRNIHHFGLFASSDPSSGYGGFDMHGASENISITDSQIHNGLIIYGRNFKASNCYISMSRGTGTTEAVRLRPESSGDYFRFENCTLVNVAGGVDYGFLFNSNFYTVTVDHVVIDGCYIRSGDPAVHVQGPTFSVFEDLQCKSLMVSDSRFVMTGSSGFAVSVVPDFGKFISETVKFSHCFIGSTSAASFIVNPSTTNKIQSVEVTGCTIAGASTGADRQIKNVHNVNVSGTRFEGSGYLELDVLDTLAFSNNHIKDSLSNRGLLISDPLNRNYLVTDTVWENSTGNSTSVQLTAFTNYNAGKNAWFASTAAPTSTALTFNLGDIVWNPSPAEGSTLGWVCVTAGSPGTWRQFATVSTA